MLNKGQSIVEYVLLIGIATMAILYMGTDFKRGVQSVFKVTIDQLGEQDKSDQDFGYQSRGYMVNSLTLTNQSLNKTTESLGNDTTRILMDERTKTKTKSLTNQEFSQVFMDNTR